MGRGIKIVRKFFEEGSNSMELAAQKIGEHIFYPMQKMKD
jgi:hypothetical protein